MKSRVLFVDDEVNILKGLQRMLWKMRDEWTMAFADSGAKALDLLDKAPADVVVTDMRMPGMDGAQLLYEVRKRHPSAVRIILSGYANEEAVLRTTGPAHQYLAKPCDSEVLTKTVKSALELRGLLGSENLRKLVSGLETLPTPPDIFSDLQTEMSSPNASAARVAKIISRDVAMTAQILKLTNSAFFSLPNKISTPQQAVQLLGFETVRALVVMSSFFSSFEGDAKTSSLLQDLSQGSLVIGAAAKAIAEAEKFDGTTADQACCAGTLSHVGTLLLVANWPKKFKNTLSMAENTDVDIVEAERKVFGACHAELGAYLLGLWGFTDPIVEAVAYHHEPSRCSYRRVNILTALHVAQSLVQSEDNEDAHKEMSGAPLDEQYLSEAGVRDRLPLWQEACEGIIHRDAET